MEYIKGGRQEFIESTLIQDAVIRNLQTLTESTQRLSQELKAKHGNVDWRGMAAFRNVLVHHYLGINIDRIWKIIEEDLPPFHANLKKILKELKKASLKKPKPTRKASKKKTGKD